MDVVTYAILKGKLGSKADLVDGKIPAEELPSYVDDIVEFDSVSEFPAEGEEGKIYVAKDTNLTYRWGGSEYVQVNARDSVLSFASASQFPATGQAETIYIAEDEAKQYMWNGSAYEELSKSTVYQPIPSSWNRNSTTSALATSIVNDADAVEGMSFLGKIYCSDLPASLIQGEAVIEIISSDQANGKNIHIILTSADTAPYRWEYSYVKINGSYGSPAGWVGYQPELVSGTNIKTINNSSILGSGNISVITESEISAIPTLDIQRLFRTEYAISTSITNGSATGDSSIWTQETASVTLSADEGYELPATIMVTGADDVYDDTTGVVTLSNATGVVTIGATCQELPPTKGDIITLDGGTARYKVLKINGTVAEVLAMDDVASSKFNNSSIETIFSDGSTGQKYENSTLDNYINSTFYDSLSANIKNAIVQKEIIQSSYRLDSSAVSEFDFAITRISSGKRWYTRKGQVLVGNRYCYALDLDDVVEYLNIESGNTISGTYINNMFFEQTTATSKNVWLDSANNTSSDPALEIKGYSGTIDFNYYGNSSTVRPAFQIDLSQVDYAKE